MKTVKYFCDLDIGNFFTEEGLDNEVIFQKVNSRLAKCVKSERIKKIAGKEVEKDFFGYGPDCEIIQVWQVPYKFGIFSKEPFVLNYDKHFGGK